mmetsp:Transcript_21264/g.52676  ORF Transcript_21264/g.52676 Transcript_21264/m.52676 type:complete len:87 (-) Transcript_21264:325-585(-)
MIRKGNRAAIIPTYQQQLLIVVGPGTSTGTKSKGLSKDLASFPVLDENEIRVWCMTQSDCRCEMKITKIVQFIIHPPSASSNDGII